MSLEDRETNDMADKYAKEAADVVRAPRAMYDEYVVHLALVKHTAMWVAQANHASNNHTLLPTRDSESSRRNAAERKAMRIRRRNMQTVVILGSLDVRPVGSLLPHLLRVVCKTCLQKVS